MKKHSSILVIGHDDIIDRSLVEYLRGKGYQDVSSSSELAINTTIQASVYDFFMRHKPEYVFLASTRSGGIEANQKHAAEFIYHNLESQNNIFYAAQKFGTKKLLYFASSCIYPKECPQPMKEEYLLTGPLEETSKPYAMAKIAGIVMAQAFRAQYNFNAISVVPATVFGPGENREISSAHVMGALTGKFIDALGAQQDQVEVWGSGNPTREFLYKDDFLDACLFLMERYNDSEIINMGSGEEISIKALAETIAKCVQYKGHIKFDTSKPDGAWRKILDSGRINALGWRAKVSIEEGIKRTVQASEEAQLTAKG